jgi:hypothetical protein
MTLFGSKMFEPADRAITTELTARYHRDLYLTKTAATFVGTLRRFCMIALAVTQIPGS